MNFFYYIYLEMCLASLSFVKFVNICIAYRYFFRLTIWIFYVLMNMIEKNLFAHFRVSTLPPAFANGFPVNTLLRYFSS